MGAPVGPVDAARLDIIPAALWGRAEAIRTVLRTLAGGGGAATVRVPLRRTRPRTSGGRQGARLPRQRARPEIHISGDAHPDGDRRLDPAARHPRLRARCGNRDRDGRPLRPISPAICSWVTGMGTIAPSAAAVPQRIAKRENRQRIRSRTWICWLAARRAVSQRARRPALARISEVKAGHAAIRAANSSSSSATVVGVSARH